MMDNREEKMGNGSNVQALSVDNHGGDDQPLLHPQAVAAGLKPVDDELGSPCKEI
jgi:hypothetical protein